MPKQQIRIRVVGLLTDGDKVFVQRKVGDETWALPSGGLEFGETLSDGLKREFDEEFGLSIIVGERLHVLENLFTHQGVFHHSVESTTTQPTRLTSPRSDPARQAWSAAGSHATTRRHYGPRASSSY